MTATNTITTTITTSTTATATTTLEIQHQKHKILCFHFLQPVSHKFSRVFFYSQHVKAIPSQSCEHKAIKNGEKKIGEVRWVSAIDVNDFDLIIY